MALADHRGAVARHGLVAAALVATTACGLALAAADVASAQSFTGAGPVLPFAVPDGTRPEGTTPAASPPARPDAPPRPTSRLRHLPAHLDGPTLAGEADARSWIVELSATEAADPAPILQLAYEAAASVSPESSALSLVVNGVAVASAAIRPPGGVRAARFAIPRGLLVRGANLLRVAAVQRHRVDCSPEAAFELWTRIRPAETGLVTNTVALVGSPLLDLADLAAVPPGPDGATAINLRLGGQRLTERGTERALQAAQLAALLGRFDHAIVAFEAPDQEGAPGLDLAVGPTPVLSGIVDLAPLGQVDGPRLALLAGAAPGRSRLLVTGRDEAEVDAALALLATALRTARPAGAAPALAALADRGGRRVEGGERITLRDLGIGEQDFTGRSFRLAVDLRLPHDMLPADYGRLVVDLAGGYAAGLERGAQLRLEVNGGEAASVPLGNPVGDRFRHQEILLPLSRLKPGRNIVAVTAALPEKADAACVDVPAADHTRLTLSDTTEIALPAFARVARSPELAHLSTGAFPYEGAARPVLHVPNPDRDTMGAAATLAVRLAAVAGHPIPFAFSVTRPAGTAPVLLVAPAQRLDPALLDRVGIDPRGLEAAWRERAAGPAEPSLARLRESGPVATCRGPAFGPVVAAASSSPSGGWDWLADAMLSLKARAEGAPVDASSTAELAGASLLVAQGTAGPGVAPVTIVSAPNATALRVGIECLTDHRVWERLAGRLSLLDAATGEVRTVAAVRPAYLETQPRSIGNLRRIAAGWLSLNPGLYAAAALLVAACLATSTHWLVGHVGRRSS